VYLVVMGDFRIDVRVAIAEFLAWASSLAWQFGQGGKSRGMCAGIQMCISPILPQSTVRNSGESAQQGYKLGVILPVVKQISYSEREIGTSLRRFSFVRKIEWRSLAP
jgi:hypothetical protein